MWRNWSKVTKRSSRTKELWSIELKKIANTIYIWLHYGAFTIHNRLSIGDHQEGELPVLDVQMQITISAMNEICCLEVLEDLAVYIYSKYWSTPCVGTEMISMWKLFQFWKWNYFTWKLLASKAGYWLLLFKLSTCCKSL